MRDAQSGLRVLVVSTDQAHSLGDVLGTPVVPTGLRDPTRVLADDADAGGGFLDALALDTLALLEARWRDVAGVLTVRFDESELGHIAPEELSALPGIQEVLGLHEVGELAKSGEWDHIVVDCASTADAMRMLTLPSTFGLYLERAWPRHRRLSSAVGDARTAAIVELMERVDAGNGALTGLLTDGDWVSAHLVLTAERVVAAEAARTLGSLALMGVRVDELIVNQLLVQDDSYEYRNLPEHPAFDWYAERISEQQVVLDELDATIGDVAAGAGSAPRGRADRAEGAGRAARMRPQARRLPAARPAAPDRRPRVRLWVGFGVSLTARVASNRIERTHPGPGRRRLDHRRRWHEAPGSAGVGPAAVHRDGRPAQGQ